MGYAHIDNLYKNQRILQEAELFCLEKIDGCSSHICFTRETSDYTNNLGEKSTGNFHYHGGNLKTAAMKAVLPSTLEAQLPALPGDKITIYGEAYGGSIQKNGLRYGQVTKFCVFDVNVDGRWLAVPEAKSLALSLGLEFVHYVQISTKLSEIDFWRDAVSEQAVRNGVTTHDGPFIRREGVVLRTLDEKMDHRGNRIIVKHKRDEERETKTPRVVDTAKLEVLKGARAIAEEWVTECRLVDHVLPKIPGEVVDMTRTKEVISAMISDINREGAGEFEPGPTVNAEIGKRTAQLLKQYFQDRLKEGQK